MSQLLDLPAIWGLFGAAVYGLVVFSTAVFASEVVEPHIVKHAWARLGIAVIFGPIAAEGFSNTVLRWVGAHADARAVALGIGLSANYLWPIIVRSLGMRFGDASKGDKL